MKTKPLMIFFTTILLILFVLNMPAVYQAAKEAAWNIIKNPEPVTAKEVVGSAESAYKNSFNPRFVFIEANGEIHKLLGRYSCNDAYKCADGNVVTVSDKADVSEQAKRVIALKDYCENNGSEFLFITFPSKEGYENNAGNLPDGVNSYTTYRQNVFQQEIRNGGVKIYDIRKLFFNKEVDKNPYFATDHHWTPESGFYAYTNIAQKLSNTYGYSMNQKSMDINNYNVSTMAIDFLGSTGKRTGKLFSGIDAITEITPKWNTQIEFCVGNDEKRSGAYEDVFLQKQHLEGKYYEANKYAAYVGSDYALTIQKNKEAVNPDTKILIIEDSFSLVVKPYYSFMFGEVAAIDARRCESSNSIKVSEYIKKENPELVIIQYTEGVGSMDDSYGNPYDFGL